MDFVSFLVLLIIAVIVAGVLHYPLKYYVTPGIWSYLSKVVIAYVGAHLGAYFFGQWWPGVAYGEIYIVPAALGALAIVIVVVDVAKTLKGSSGSN
ncbi:MAG: hypothetical protein ACE5FV_10690 [Woeseia sp.]